jgi:hypothetical protein
MNNDRGPADSVGNRLVNLIFPCEPITRETHETHVRATRKDTSLEPEV